MKRFVPSFLHEVFGERQSFGIMVFILSFGVATASLIFIFYPEMAVGLPLWQTFLAWLLVMDIASGNLANFTASTNHYYAAGPESRRQLFIAVHVHLPAISLLLEVGLHIALLIWFYTVVGAFIVIGKGGEAQKLWGGSLICAGITIVLMIPTSIFPPYMQIISLLFIVKVIYSFGVNHYDNESFVQKKKGDPAL